MRVINAEPTHPARVNSILKSGSSIIAGDYLDYGTTPRLEPHLIMPKPSNGRSLDRVLFVLALIGVLVVVHLAIQQGRGFDQGCVGFLAPASVEGTFDCGAVLESSAGTFLGISNTAWGLFFYLGVAFFSAVLLVGKGYLLSWSERLRPILIAGGLLYTLYLVYYQFFVINELCALCLTSAAIVVLISIIQGLAFQRSRQSAAETRPQPAAERMKDYRFIGVLAVALVVLVGADFLYFRSIENVSGVSLDQPTATAPGAAAGSQAPQVAVCGYDTSRPAIDDQELLGLHDPSTGNPDAAVTVIEFFDPNCPHCKTMHTIMSDVIAEHADKAHFVYKPIALWPYSLDQIDALYAASQDDKFDEMLSAQFDRQQQGGLSMRQIQSIADDIGMNSDQLAQRIERGVYRPSTMEQRRIASEIGLTGVPAVLINGRFIGPTSRSGACIGQLIEEAAG